MRIAFLIPALVLMFLSSGCAQAQKPASEKKILIVYLSRTNNTKAVANLIHKNVGGKLVALELEKPYPEDYKATVDQVSMVYISEKLTM